MNKIIILCSDFFLNNSVINKSNWLMNESSPANGEVAPVCLTNNLAQLQLHPPLPPSCLSVRRHLHTAADCQTSPWRGGRERNDEELGENTLRCAPTSPLKRSALLACPWRQARSAAAVASPLLLPADLSCSESGGGSRPWHPARLRAFHALQPTCNPSRAQRVTPRSREAV